MDDWERQVPLIEGAKGYRGVMMPAKFSGVHVLAELHADPAKRRAVGGVVARATTARPLVVGRTASGAWLVMHLETMEILGVGETRAEALADAIAHDSLAPQVAPG